jgi:flagellar basal body-associated protein FliL
LKKREKRETKKKTKKKNLSFEIIIIIIVIIIICKALYHMALCSIKYIFIYTQCGIISFLFVFQGDWERLLVTGRGNMLERRRN